MDVGTMTKQTHDMIIEAHRHGHKILYIDDMWIYEDTREEINSVEPRPCVKCNALPADGHDACIANLPGVKNACCGHGVKRGYVHFENDRVIRGTFEDDSL